MDTLFINALRIAQNSAICFQHAEMTLRIFNNVTVGCAQKLSETDYAVSKS